MAINNPIPKIKRRAVNAERERKALSEGFDPILARIIASRPVDSLKAKLSTLDNPHQLADMNKAVDRLIVALQNNEIIGIETDHDCDGQTSHAVIYSALKEYFLHPEQNIRSYIGHRLKEGYGLSLSVANRILADSPRPTLVITADNGSADEAQIALLKTHGIDVIVTDHHEIPSEGIPVSAKAVINPTREDCKYPDRFIAGCMVAWLFMAATRQAIIENKNRTIPSLAALLDFVAVGTIADCVSMARSANNRAVVQYGMKLIQAGVRPCWQAVLPLVSNPLSSEDLGFKIGPLLNSDGRLACAFGSVSFLLAKDLNEAKHWVDHLQVQNKERRAIQDKITQLALEQAKQQYQAGKRGLCIFLEDGHAGVHGISASRIKDLFGCPVFILCPKTDEPNLLTGSGRSIEGVHLRDVLQKINDQHPDILTRFGGHQGAAGLAIKRDKLDQFSLILDQVIQRDSPSEIFGPVVLTDGILPQEYINRAYIEKMVNQLEPFGREFESPNFEIIGKVMSISFMGQTRIHARLGLAVEDLWFEAVWFNCRKDQNHPLPIEIGQEVQVVFAPKLQTFRQERQLSCQVVAVSLQSHVCHSEA